MSDISIHARYSFTFQGVDIHILRLSETGGLDFLYLTKDLEWKESEGMLCEPFVTVPFDAATQFMDDLWRANVRPTDLAMVDGERAAMKDNLKDLRAIMAWAISGGSDV